MGEFSVSLLSIIHTEKLGSQELKQPICFGSGMHVCRGSTHIRCIPFVQPLPIGKFFSVSVYGSYCNLENHIHPALDLPSCM